MVRQMKMNEKYLIQRIQDRWEVILDKKYAIMMSKLAWSRLQFVVQQNSSSIENVYGPVLGDEEDNG